MPPRAGGSCSGAARTEATSGDTDAERVEAPFLQLVMERLWRASLPRRSSRADALPARRARRGGAHRREPPARGTRLAHRPEQAVAADLFRFLVTRSRTKIAHPASDLAEWTHRPEPEVDGRARQALPCRERTHPSAHPPSADGRRRNALRALPRCSRPAGTRVECCNVARNARSRGSSRSGTSAAPGSKGSSRWERPPSQSLRSSSDSHSSNVRMRRSGHVRRRHEASTPQPSGSSKRTPS